MGEQSNSILASPLSSSRNSQEMKRIARLRERFIAGEEIEPDALSPAILNSWIRSRAAGVDPNLARAPCQPVTQTTPPSELRSWVSGADRVLTLLADFFHDSPQLITLVDRHCRVLAVRGGRKALELAERIAVVPGADWSESATGCNSLATSIYTGLPMRVSWQENYIAVAHEWSGVAAAIRHPSSGEILGGIGINGYDTLTHPKVAELCIEAENLIEASVRAHDAMLRGAVLERFAQLVARYPSDAILALDSIGRIVTLTPAMEKLASLSAALLVGRLLHKTALAQRLELFNETSDPAFLLGRAAIEGLQLFPVKLEQETGLVLLLSGGRTRVGKGKPATEQWPTAYSFSDLTGENPRFRKSVSRARRASECDWPVLLLGESGTGKELFAQSIHHLSSRRHGPFVPLDCATLSDDLIGTELFGYNEGTFTGALRGGKEGRVQLADHGTLFLDDVDNLPAKVQMSLLRVLETQQVVRLGGHYPQTIDVRVIAASNRNLEDLVRDGAFRRDLYHRLSVVTVEIPPLRDRPDDVLLLATQILAKHGPGVSLSDSAKRALQNFDWPGNIRELRNVLLEALVFASGCQISARDLRGKMGGIEMLAPAAPQSRQGILEQTESELILAALHSSENVCDAAVRLGVHHATLYRRMKKYRIAFSPARKSGD